MLGEQVERRRGPEGRAERMGQSVPAQMGMAGSVRAPWAPRLRKVTGLVHSPGSTREPAPAPLPER